MWGGGGVDGIKGEGEIYHEYIKVYCTLQPGSSVFFYFLKPTHSLSDSQYPNHCTTPMPAPPWRDKPMSRRRDPRSRRSTARKSANWVRIRTHAITRRSTSRRSMTSPTSVCKFTGQEHTHDGLRGSKSTFLYSSRSTMQR